MIHWVFFLPIGICGWGGLAINAAAQDTRIKAMVASTMYDLPRGTANGYSNGGWNITSSLSFLNMTILHYSNEIRSAVLLAKRRIPAISAVALL